LRRYAWLELIVSGLGLATLFVIPALGGAYAALAGPGGFGLVLRVLLAAIALLPATIAMGATLPAIAGWVRSTPNGIAWLGYCYAANTAGAIVGSVLAGFYLLRVHDANVAVGVAALLNLSVAAVALGLDARTRAVPAAGTLTPLVHGAGATPWPIYVAIALSGMTALSAEVLWTRHLALLLGGTVYTFALILAVLLFGLAVGAGLGSRVGRRMNPRLALAACQLALCVAIAGATCALARSLPYWPIDVTLPATAAVMLPLDLLRTAIVVLPAALLWGASWPLALAASAAAAPKRDPQRLVGELYGANTAGAIVGALATTFVLVVAIGSRQTQQLAIVLCAVSGLCILLATRSVLSVRRAGAAALLGAVALGVAYAVPELPPAFVAYGRFLPSRADGVEVVYVGEGRTASVAVAREPSGIVTYHNAGKTQASTYPQDLRLQRMLGHLTTLIPERPSSVLVIGLGAGITAGAVSIDPAVQRVVVAEIEPLAAEVAGRFFAEHNHGVETNPKVELTFDDGRHLLATTTERFDAITSDPLDPWVKGAAALYTREFWQLARSRLNDGGVVTVFLQLYESTEDAVRSEIATFFEVFPHGAVFANTVEGGGYDAVLVGRANDEPIDLSRIEHRLDRSDYAPVARSLRDSGFDSALDLFGTYTGGAHELEDWLEGAAINTDRNLRLQYLAGAALNRYDAAAIFSRMTAKGPVPNRLFAGTPAELEELRQRLAGRRGRY
jgi:spermidine synthase